MLECVVNISEGRRDEVVDALAAVAGRDLLDLHRDGDHNRCVLTLIGTAAPRAVAAEAVRLVDLNRHRGAHPRIGAVDVVPFVPLDGSTMADAVAARDDFARWAAASLGVPCFLYGPERSLPEVRRGAFHELAPDTGPRRPHRTAGAVAVGARPVLVAYNLWLTTADIALARRIATSLRGPTVRALGLALGEATQVSCNLVAPLTTGPMEVFEAVAAEAPIARTELVGLIPTAVLERIPEERWAQLDLGTDRTIEARLAGRASSSG